jgi:hypothetical protein
MEREREMRIKRGEHGEYDNRIEPRYCLRWWYCCFYTVCECGLNVDAQIVTGGVSEFHCSLQSTAQHTIPRSVDGEAVGVSEVVEGGSAFEYNKNCLRQEFVSFCTILHHFAWRRGVGCATFGWPGCWTWIGMIGFCEGCRFSIIFLACSLSVDLGYRIVCV